MQLSKCSSAWPGDQHWVRHWTATKEPRAYPCPPEVHALASGQPLAKRHEHHFLPGPASTEGARGGILDPTGGRPPDQGKQTHYRAGEHNQRHDGKNIIWSGKESWYISPKVNNPLYEVSDHNSIPLLQTSAFFNIRGKWGNPLEPQPTEIFSRDFPQRLEESNGRRPVLAHFTHLPDQFFPPFLGLLHTHPHPQEAHQQPCFLLCYVNPPTPS